MCGRSQVDSSGMESAVSGRSCLPGERVASETYVQLVVSRVARPTVAKSVLLARAPLYMLYSILATAWQVKSETVYHLWLNVVIELH